MKHGKLRFVSLVVPAAAVAACASASSGGASNDPLSPLDGTWACTVDGQGPQVSLETFSYCTRLETYADGTDADWLTCAYEISGNAGTAVICGRAVTITMGTISVSADGDTLTIRETGEDPPDAGTVQTLTATCTRTAPSMVRCGPDGGVTRAMEGGSSGGDEAGSTKPPPQCTGNTDCPGCSRCESGVCYVCPIGDLGVCTC